MILIVIKFNYRRKDFLLHHVMNHYTLKIKTASGESSLTVLADVK